MVQGGSLRDLRAQKKHERSKPLPGSIGMQQKYLHLVQVVQKVDNTIYWLDHYPAYGMVCFVNSIHWKANYLVGSVIQLQTTWHFINQSLQQAIFNCFKVLKSARICLILDWNYGSLQWRLCDARN